MDRVRFGRALGYGARHAAKTLMAAADAATAPGPSASATPGQRSAASPPSSVRATAAGSPVPAAASARPLPVAAARVAAVSTHASASGRNMVSSVKRFSGTVMLQVIGTFFAVFALSFAGGVWRMRAAFHQPLRAPEAQKLYAAMLMFVVFSYFTATSFLRARKLEKS